MDASPNTGVFSAGQVTQKIRLADNLDACTGDIISIDGLLCRVVEISVIINKGGMHREVYATPIRAAQGFGYWPDDNTWVMPESQWSRSAAWLIFTVFTASALVLAVWAVT